MKKMVIAALSAVIVAGSAIADVTVKFPVGQAKEKYVVGHLLTSDILSKGTKKYNTDSVPVVNDVMTIKVDPTGNAQYIIPITDRQNIWFYTSPGDSLVVDIRSISPLQWSASGNELMDGIFYLEKKFAEYMAKFKEIESSDTVAWNNLRQEVADMWKVYIKENPKHPASLYAMTQLHPNEFLTAFNDIDESLKNTPYYPELQRQKLSMEHGMATKKRHSEMQSGNFDAPNFTLKNLEGKDVALSDFKGKWVILDFWGSWCGWCIKGFPALKDAYKQYKPELEVIGIDCRDSEQAWRAAVKKYELPWVQVRNPQQDESQLMKDYAVNGFPTKIIINPKGKIVNITVGEDPSFFDVLAKFIKGE